MTYRKVTYIKRGQNSTRPLKPGTELAFFYAMLEVVTKYLFLKYKQNNCQLCQLCKIQNRCQVRLHCSKFLNNYKCCFQQSYKQVSYIKNVHNFKGNLMDIVLARSHGSINCLTCKFHVKFKFHRTDVEYHSYRHCWHCCYLETFRDTLVFSTPDFNKKKKYNLFFTIKEQHLDIMIR